MTIQEPVANKATRTWSPEVVRVVCISDTHCQHEHLIDHLPLGDVLVHAGDFTYSGKQHEVEDFRDFLKAVPHTLKVVVAGNHELTFHEDYYHAVGQQRFHSQMMGGGFDPQACRRLITDLQDSHQVYYVENQHLSLPDSQLSVWGTPWTPLFKGWAFNYEPRGSFCQELYATIPSGLDLLITHGPPFKVGDVEHAEGKNTGCEELLREVKTRVKPRVHIFGHIHECHGVFQDEEGILYLNASTCNLQYRPSNAPIVLDIPRDRSKPVQVVSDHKVETIDLSGTPWEEVEESVEGVS